MPRTVLAAVRQRRLNWLRAGVAVGALALTLAVNYSTALASSFTPGDVVVYRVGTGSGGLSGSAFPVFLDEYEPSGKLVESLALPTSTSGSNKPLLASGSATSEGLLTLSANDEYLMMTGYDTSVGTSKLSETLSASVPRTVGRVSGAHEINTSTALTDFGNGNNPRGATSSDGTHIWVSGAGKSTAGGVHFTTLGSSTSTLMSSSDTNARAVAIFDGQLYTSSDPTKEGIDIATVGSGLPTTGGQTTSNLPFTSAPGEPYAFSMVTLGLGSAPDTIYVAENSSGAVVKYGLSGGKWTKEGSVAVANVTGVTADDINGVVSIYATSSGSSGEGGTLWKITDNSGVGGTLSGTATLIATAPANEAFRGVAFTPGTTFGSGGTPPPPEPTITPAEANLPAAMDDPTNPTLGVEVSDSEYAAGELSVTATSSNTSVAPQSGVSVEGAGAQRTLKVTPGTSVGYSTITLTVEAPNGATATTSVNYALSAYQGDETDRYYDGAGNGSTAIDVGGGYMIVGDDENNVLRLYHERFSGQPVKTFDFTSKLPFGATEIDIESSARAGNVLYWMGSLSNSKKGKAEPGRDVLFAAEIKGSGASTELTYLGSYTHLREDLIAWDEANGNPLGFKESTEVGVPSNEARGFNVEGLEFAAGSTSTAYVAFRAPLEPPNAREDALLVPVTNFSSLIGGGTTATFGTPIEWNLGGLGIREIRRNAANEYLFIAGTSDDSNSTFGLYTWDGNPADLPVLTNTPVSAVAEGAWESIVSVPEPIASGDEIELLEDNGDTVWYGDGLDSKDGLPAGLTKDLGRIFTIELPAPGAPGAPQLSSGVTPNANGQFTLSWEASKGGSGVTYTLQHENAQGGWSDVASGLSATEYTFGPGNPEAEGTWTYRVIASDAGGESEPSEASTEVKVDETAPNAPTATPDRAPDYAGGGGWYKDSVTVSFTANGDPALADGSPGSGVNPASLSGPETFTTDGAHEASGTVSDNVGNQSAPGTLTVQVDASPPELQIECPATATIDAKGVVATVTAFDGQSGLASDPSGVVPIDTEKPGPVTITRTAVDNVGHVTESSCTTVVQYAEVVSGTVNGKFIVRSGQNVEFAPTARFTGSVKVQPGGSVFIDGATLEGSFSASGATSARICGASLSSAKVSGSTGPVVIGEAGGECAPSDFSGSVNVKGNTGGVRIEGESLVDPNVIVGALKVSSNGGPTTVIDNEIAASLTVKGNGSPTIDQPNVVKGRSKLQ
jgi:hypothetical protein